MVASWHGDWKQWCKVTLLHFRYHTNVYHGQRINTQVLKVYETTNMGHPCLNGPIWTFSYAYHCIWYKRCQYTNTPLLQAKTNSLFQSSVSSASIFHVQLTVPGNSTSAYFKICHFIFRSQHMFMYGFLYSSSPGDQSASWFCDLISFISFQKL